MPAASPAQVLARLLDGFVVTQLLHTAVGLGVPDALAGGPRSGADVAAAVGADPARLTRVLRGLAIEGVLDERPDGTFALTPVGELLRTDVPHTMAALARVRGEVYAPASVGLLAGVRDGVTPFEAVYGEPFFTHLARDAGHGATFHAAMARRADLEAADVVRAYDFTAFNRVVDVGGGEGALLSAVLQAAPEAAGVVADQEDVLPAARERLRRDGVLDRCGFVATDFFTAVPGGGDAYVLSRILHDWEDEPATRILEACRAAMAPDARLVVVDQILPERALDQPAAIRMDVLMLILLGARERTAAQFEALLGGTGFRTTRVVATASPIGLGVIEAVPAR